MDPSFSPRDLLIELLVGLTDPSNQLDEEQRYQLRLCRYLAALAPTPDEFVRLLREQSEGSLHPASARSAASSVLAIWQARVSGPAAGNIAS
jgi:hypothetical protein